MTTPWARLAIAAAVVIAVALGVFAGTTFVGAPAASAAPSLALALAPTPRPTPNPSPRSAPDQLTVYPVGPIPTDARIVVAGEPGKERLLLLDVTNHRVSLVAQFDGPGSFKDARVVELTANSAGDLYVICLHADGPLARLYFIRPASGDVRTYTIPTAENPRLSPDGALLAVSRNQPADQKGLWLLNTSDGNGRRLTTDEGRRATRAVQWAADGTRFSALLDTLDFSRVVVIVGVDGGMSGPFGKATDARWRGDDLLYYSNDLAAPVNIVHAGVVGVAYPSPPGVIVSRAELKPRTKDLAMRLNTQGTLPKLVLYDSTSGATTELMAEATWVLAFWWSGDANRLYVWILDNDESIIREAISGETIVTFCFRVGVTPPCKAS